MLKLVKLKYNYNFNRSFDRFERAHSKIDWFMTNVKQDYIIFPKGMDYFFKVCYIILYLFYTIFTACLSIAVGIWNKLILCNKIYIFTLFSWGSQKAHSLCWPDRRFFWTSLQHIYFNTTKNNRIRKRSRYQFGEVTITSYHTEPSTLLEIKLWKK